MFWVGGWAGWLTGSVDGSSSIGVAPSAADWLAASRTAALVSAAVTTSDARHRESSLSVGIGGGGRPGAGGASAVEIPRKPLAVRMAVRGDLTQPTAVQIPDTAGDIEEMLLKIVGKFITTFSQIIECFMKY